MNDEEVILNAISEQYNKHAIKSHITRDTIVIDYHDGQICTEIHNGRILVTRVYDIEIACWCCCGDGYIDPDEECKECSGTGYDIDFEEESIATFELCNPECIDTITQIVLNKVARPFN